MLVSDGTVLGGPTRGVRLGQHLRVGDHGMSMAGRGAGHLQRPAPGSQSEIELVLTGSDPFRREQPQRRHLGIAVSRTEMLDPPRPPPSPGGRPNRPHVRHSGQATSTA